MARARPLTFILEFDDGSRTSTSFAALPSYLQSEILRQPFASRPSHAPEEERFVLIEWDDGWQEVIEVDAACTEINRYYVITRPEEVGRLSLNRRNGYPELIEIVRKPSNIEKITFVDTFRLAPGTSHREGKKIDHFLSLKKEGDSLSEVMSRFKEVVKEEGLDVKELRSGDPGQLREQYETIRRKMGIKASQRQQDVHDFIAYLAATAT
jgi:predicted CopG family antitoxin